MSYRRRETFVQSDYVAEPGDLVGRVLETKGGHIFSVETESGASVDAFLPTRFRRTQWIRRGSFVVLRILSEATQPSIIHILDRDDVKDLKKTGRWPACFTTTNTAGDITISGNANMDIDFSEQDANYDACPESE